MADLIMELDLDVPLSPRRPGHGGDLAAVRLEEREDGMRILCASRPVRRGEALLVEDALFLSPCEDDEFHALISNTCDQDAAGSAALAAGADYPLTTSSMLSSPATIVTSTPASASWMGVWEQLTLVIVQAFLVDEDAQNCEEFRNLRGDAERWQELAGRLWVMLREDVREQLSFEALCEIYSTVMENGFQADGGRLGIFNLGSYAEHNCAPNAFKEIFVPVESSSRPGSPCSPNSGSLSPPPSPSRGVLMPPAVQRPKLVLRAAHDLAEGDLVTLSFVQRYLPTWRRQELLQASYGFLCSCDRCERAPEVCCAFICPRCGAGPCNPTAPVAAAGGDLRSHSLRCETCGDLEIDEAYLEVLIGAENSEDFSDEVTRLIHPYHHKYFLTYMSTLQAMPAHQRIQAAESMMEAQRRLAGSDATPLLGQLCEHIASAQMELGDHHQAIASFRRAREMFAISHRGLPDAGHDDRCYQQEASITAGPLGAAPRRLSRVPTGLLARSPSLPSLAEGFEEGVDEG
eukprot:TRINITY_DN4329_c1_g1_i1.p1 TRINITY_DN4329_c1_g1~~TRINITY_DN4329_c1_g1_i1.p1  ORF type:complete len:518 (-),score=90.93 TRINITY_DN4329_c1_g1_i1:133-1686(-)